MLWMAKMQSFLIDVPFSWLVFFIIILVGGKIEWFFFLTSTCFWCFIFVGDIWQTASTLKGYAYMPGSWQRSLNLGEKVRKVAWLHPMEKCREPVTHEINGTVFLPTFYHKQIKLNLSKYTYNIQGLIGYRQRKFHPSFNKNSGRRN